MILYASYLLPYMGTPSAFWCAPGVRKLETCSLGSCWLFEAHRPSTRSARHHLNEVCSLPRLIGSSAAVALIIVTSAAARPIVITAGLAGVLTVLERVKNDIATVGRTRLKNAVSPTVSSPAAIKLTLFCLSGCSLPHLARLYLLLYFF